MPRKFIGITCPVCKKMFFSKPEDWERKNGIKPEDLTCRYCGWKYDYDQALYPDKKKGANHSSVKEAKKAYRENRRKYPHYEFLKQASLDHIKDHPCPVCGKHIHKGLPHNLVCPICLWEDDGMEKYPDEVSSANGKSFRQALSECKSD